MKAKRKPAPKTKAEKSEWWIAFGRRFRVTRGALSITEEEAASAYGVSLKSYRRLESGANQRGRHYNLVCFAKKFGVSFDWLIAGTTAARPRPRPRLVRNRDAASVDSM